MVPSAGGGFETRLLALEDGTGALRRGGDSGGKAILELELERAREVLTLRSGRRL